MAKVTSSEYSATSIPRAIVPGQKQVANMATEQSRSSVVEEPPEARRSKGSVVTHGRLRVIETLPYQKGGTGLKNDLLRSENNELRKAYLSATKREYLSALKSDNGLICLLVPNTLRLRLENHLLKRENLYLDQCVVVHKKIQQAVRSSDQQLSKVIDALRGGNVPDIKAQSKLFAEAVEPLNKNREFAVLSHGDRYTDRLLTRLTNMRLKDLENLGAAAEEFLSITGDTVVKNLYVAVAAELLLRNDPRSRGYGNLSSAQLRTSTACTTLLLEQAKKQGLGTDTSDTVRGTHFMLGDLESIHKHGSLRLATLIVQDPATTPESLQNKSVEDLDEIAWAVDLCSKQPSQVDQAMTSKLKQLNDKVEVHQAEVQKALTDVAKRTGPSTDKELVALGSKIAASGGRSRSARETALKVVTEEIASRKIQAVRMFHIEMRAAAYDLCNFSSHKGAIDKAIESFAKSAVMLQKASVVFQDLGLALSDDEKIKWVDDAIGALLPYELEILVSELADSRNALGKAVSKATADKKGGGFDYVAQLYASIDAAHAQGKLQIAKLNRETQQRAAVLQSMSSH